MRDRDEGNPLLAGWIGRNLAATFRHGPCIFNSTSGAWEAVGPRTAGQFVTDGSTLAGSTQPGVLTLIASGQDAKEINLPAWADDWAFWEADFRRWRAAGT